MLTRLEIRNAEQSTRWPRKSNGKRLNWSQARLNLFVCCERAMGIEATSGVWEGSVMARLGCAREDIHISTSLMFFTIICAALELIGQDAALSNTSNLRIREKPLYRVDAMFF
jgi:hypothetical protein